MDGRGGSSCFGNFIYSVLDSSQVVDFLLSRAFEQEEEKGWGKA